MVPPGFSNPCSSAASIILTAMRSFELPPGLRYSIFAATTPEFGPTTEFNRTSGVFPIRSTTWFAIRIATSSQNRADDLRLVRRALRLIRRGHGRAVTMPNVRMPKTARAAAAVAATVGAVTAIASASASAQTVEFPQTPSVFYGGLCGGNIRTWVDTSPDWPGRAVFNVQA